MIHAWFPENKFKKKTLKICLYFFFTVNHRYQTMLPKLKAQITLQQCRDAFLADFDFYDVEVDLLRDRVFTEQERDDIISQATKVDRIDKMYFLLSLDPQKYVDFMHSIESKYDWLYAKMTRCFNDDANDLQLEPVCDKISLLLKSVPRLADYNVHRTEYVYNLNKLIIFIVLLLNTYVWFYF